jgi:peptidoglycan/LPS O-acetylase OafA/YrhL
VLNSLQSIRALATFSVVAFHAVQFVRRNTGLSLPPFSLGVGALDVFFVLSGFIMVHITKDSETPGGFLFKRFTRIAPLYWVMTTLAIAVAFASPWFFPHTNLSVLSILSSYLFLPYLNGEGELMPILFVGWTISIEIVFFAAFSLALMLPKGRRTAAIVLILGAVWLVGRALSGWIPIAAFYSHKYTVDVIIGCLLAPAARSQLLAAFARRTPMLPIIVGALTMLCLLGPLTHGRPVLTGYALCPLAAALVLACALQDLHRTPAKRGLLAFYGDCSYSVYLLHPFTIPAAGLVAISLFGPGLAGSALALALGLAATLSLAPLVYFFVELRCSQLLREASWPSLLRLRGKSAPSPRVPT